GLAKALDAVDLASASSHADIVTSSAISHAGMIFGTAAYMSPEQARGEAIDKRTDIWAFGCVMYEILTGQPAFPGTIIDDILTAVLNQDPDWSLLPSETPADVVKLLRKCLEKNADRRLHDIADARIEIVDAGVSTQTPLPQKRRWPALVAIAGV